MSRIISIYSYCWKRTPFLLKHTLNWVINYLLTLVRVSFDKSVISDIY